MKTSRRQPRGAPANRHAFSLIEVMVAMTVSVGIMMTIVSHLWYASEVWRRGQQKISLQNQTRMVHNFLTRELTATYGINYPAVGESGSYLEYRLRVASSSPVLAGSIQYRMLLNGSIGINATGVALVRTVTGSDANGTTLMTYPIFANAQSFVIARDVVCATFTRPSPWTLDVYLRVESDSHRGDDVATDEVLFYDATTTYLIPGG